jgi:hypothetical protein
MVFVYQYAITFPYKPMFCYAIDLKIKIPNSDQNSAKNED